MRVRYPDLFPFVVAESAGALPPGSFAAVPLATAFDWYWRVKTWRGVFSTGGPVIITDLRLHSVLEVSELSVTVESTIAPSPGPGSAAESPAEGTPYDERLLTIPSYSDGAGDAATGAVLAGTLTISVPGATGGYSYYMSGNLSFAIFAPELLYTDYVHTPTPLVPRLTFDPISGLCRPTFCAIGNVGIAIHPGPFGAFIIGTGPVPPGYAYEGTDPSQYGPTTIAVTIGGTTQTVDGWVFGTAGGTSLGNPMSIDMSRCSPAITIAPSEYWAYAGEGGTALYDSRSGGPSINPATGVPFTPGEIAAAHMP